jgi:hypothetical protein
VIDTRLWSSTPFNNPTAFTDLTGQIELFHRALAKEVFGLTGRAYAVYPLGTGRGPEWLQALQAQNSAAAAALGIAPPPDLSTFDLRDPGEFASWTFSLGQFSRTLALAAGLP